MLTWYCIKYGDDYVYWPNPMALAKLSGFKPNPNSFFETQEEAEREMDDLLCHERWKEKPMKVIPVKILYAEKEVVEYILKERTA